MKTKKRLGLFLVGIVAIFLMSISVATAQNKVAVIPLMEEAKLDPFAPVAAESPPNSAYTDNGDGTLTDLVIGLTWQQQDDNVRRNWEDAWDYCAGNVAGLPGTGWRLPSIDELMSIVYYGIYGPAINSVAFPGTNSAFYWSATTIASNSSLAWDVYFGGGDLLNDYKSTTGYVRCVSGLPGWDSLFKNNGNGTVTDLATGLTWQQQDDNVTRNWEDAWDYCTDNDAGLPGTGWRLPAIKELRSIVDDRVYGPAIDSEVFPDTKLSGYWSATTHANNSSNAWQVSLYYSFNSWGSKSTSTSYVRCVR